MLGRTHRMRRLVAAAGIAASIAVSTAQPALAFDGRSPDTREAAEQANAGSVFDRRSPDTRDAIEEIRPIAVVDARSPDARDAAENARPISVLDARSPDTRDAAEGAKPGSHVTVVDARSPEGFSWGDFGIGVAIGLTLLLAGLAAGGVDVRQLGRGTRSPAA